MRGPEARGPGAPWRWQDACLLLGCLAVVCQYESEMAELRMIAVVGALLVASPVGAQTVIDGNTMRYDGVIVHLWGIDAPEKGQTCGDGWPAGAMAATYLEGL